jgi:uncharacterized protein
MPLIVNLRHLDAHPVQLKGQTPVEELDIETRDEIIQLSEPLEYHLEVEKLDDSLLARGRLRLALDCKCVRCLKPFEYPLEMNDWTCHLPLHGEEAAPVVNDCVDLTPYVREDILLSFPQHPLCEPECGGLPKNSLGKEKETSKTGRHDAGSPLWAELNKLKF